jgi:hypothetical protein
LLNQWPARQQMPQHPTPFAAWIGNADNTAKRSDYFRTSPVAREKPPETKTPASREFGSADGGQERDALGEWGQFAGIPMPAPQSEGKLEVRRRQVNVGVIGWCREGESNPQGTKYRRISRAFRVASEPLWRLISQVFSSS